MPEDDLKAIYERLDQQELALEALQRQVKHLTVDRHWTDEISALLNWTERNRVSLFSFVALVGVIMLGFNVSVDQRDKVFDRLTTPEAIASLLLAGTGVAVAATKK